MNDIKSFEAVLRAAPTKAAFLNTCRSLKTPDIRIDRDALSSYASGISAPETMYGWEEYLTPGNDLPTDFVELAVSTVQNAGYLYTDSDSGALRRWSQGGSEVKALLEKIDYLRARNNLPTIHIQSQSIAQTKLRSIFNDAPYTHKRNKLWQELAAPGKSDQLKDILQQSELPNGRYCFDFTTLKALAKVLPQGLGEDPFLKKAALLTILFAGVAHNKLAPRAVSLDIIVPADYRVPQSLHNIGVLRFSDRMVRAIESGELLQEYDDLVAQLRVQTILAVDEILQNRPDLQMHHVDGDLWTAGYLFDPEARALNQDQAARRKALEQHGYRSGFSVKGFRSRTERAISVETLRF